LRTRCEIKNINSLSSLGRGIVHEALRHIDLYDTGDAPHQETRHWDEAAGRTRSGRSKEDADDYRYFPEPDLVPLEPSAADIAAIDEAQPLLPAARRQALTAASGGDEAAVDLVVARGDDQFALDAIAAGADGSRVLVHLTNNVADGIGRLTVETFAALIAMETGGELSSTQTKDVLAELVASGGDPAAIAADRGYEAVDTGELEGVIDELIAAHPDEWDRFCGDDEKAAKKMSGFFTGQVMKATQGQADGKVVAQILAARRG
ncbi:MAG: Asp-tRNA(Asn)/Glu-tRNA(Gln) amidotransferase subunit GatB, partial [Acidimicrobiia bacterium]|nr:Asp-tRNA(Asn)/Glu-tRNA(Gln) amidotransferase subunit GatB [Acidimicrobiia bacterium]